MASKPSLLQQATGAINAGNVSNAIECLERSLQQEPGNAPVWFLLGRLLALSKRHPEALNCFQKATSLDSSQAEYHAELAMSLIENGKTHPARSSARRATELNPNLSSAFSALGSALTILEQYPEALRCGLRSIELDPHNGLGHFVIGMCHKNSRQLDESIASLKRAWELLPGDVRPLRMLTQVLFLARRFQDAMNVGNEALKLDPNHVDTLKVVGGAAQQLLHHDVAIQALTMARKLAPKDANILAILGYSLFELGRLWEARDVLREGSRLAPTDPSFAQNLGAVAKDSGELDNAIGEFKMARRIKPSYVEALSNELCCAQYLPDITLAKLAHRHEEFERLYAGPLKSTQSLSKKRSDPLDAARDADRPLRIGFVSGDFHIHPVGSLTIAALEQIDRSNFPIYCYSNGPKRDAVTDRFQKIAVEFRNIREVSDEIVCEQIRQDKIDILVDFSGHTSRNRLLVFARKPAPVQATWLGYSGTTGLHSIDFLLSDDHHIPTGFDSCFTEKIVRLPGPHLTYELPTDLPDVEPPPITSRGAVTFGSFNNPAKLNTNVIELWSRILQEVPGSTLILKYRALTDRLTLERFQKLFQKFGVKQDQVEFLDWSDNLAMLKQYHRVDIALDPFPFGGGMTSFSAMQMGVPVVSLEGETFVGRQTPSYYRHMNLADWIATDRDDYVRRAISLAADVDQLKEMRMTLRQRLAQSSLCDPNQLARGLEGAFRKMWVD